MMSRGTEDHTNERLRLELIDTLAAGDGQDWPDFWENPQQRQIAETMYGAQADHLLASSWFAELAAARTERDRWEKAADEHVELLRQIQTELGPIRGREWDVLLRARRVVAERDALAAKIEAVKAVCAEVERDDIDHLDRFGQHLPGSVVCVAEMVRAALSGVGGNPTPAATPPNGDASRWGGALTKMLDPYTQGHRFETSASRSPGGSS